MVDLVLGEDDVDKVPAAVGAAVLLTLPVGTMIARGHYLSWFNVGGDLGHRISIVGEDWGQDVWLLGQWAKANDQHRIVYKPYGLASTHEMVRADVGLKTGGCRTGAKKGWLAVHAATAHRKEPCIELMRWRPPDQVLEHHILLWKLPLRP